MDNRQYKRTLFLPCLQGQYKLWKNSILETCNDVNAVVSFGDLIGCNEDAADSGHRGPNMATLSFTRLYTEYHDDWTQLIGPNELAALSSPDTWTNAQSTSYLRDAWLDVDRFKTAAVNNGRLVTHGGLTYGEWISIDRPESSQEASERLNEKYNGTLYQGLSYRLNGRPNYSANPIWADPLLETYPSWTTAPEDCPFDQTHAEASVNNELGRKLLQEEWSPLSVIPTPRFKSYGSILTIGEAEFTAVTLNVAGPMLTSLPTRERLRIAQTQY